ncbi:glycosyltransferase [Neobacillus bataviensis]|uniref:glycosyltransferase n=1 Tax=Neobacillus bataviensis TaxID=220685 RepID=UPI001CBD0B55|nr:glycosyltransferase [Neobacillus bataviensis]
MNRKVKIMQIIPNLGVAGAEIMVENLSVNLKNDLFEVCVVSLYDEQSAITKRLENQNIPLFYLGKKKGLDIKLIFRLYNLILKERPKVIHTHRYAMQYAIPAAILAKIPIRIHTIHNIAEKEVGKLQRKLHSFFYKYCKVIPVSISPIVKDSVIKEYELQNEHLPMIFNGIDLNKCLYKKSYIKENSKVSILHIGRFSMQKNHLGLIDAFKIVHDKSPDTVLRLIGTGEMEKDVREKIKELDLLDSVEILGLKDDVHPYLNKADIFVLPSTWEGMPITLIEAMATGLPIVATNVGGVPDMIKDNISGLLVDTNKEEIAAALLKLIYDENLRQQLGSAAKDASKQFSAQEMAREYIKVFENNIHTLNK